jgi:hypothetical protein
LRTFGCERATNRRSIRKVSGKFIADLVRSYITLFSFLGAEIIQTSLADGKNALFIITFLFPEEVDFFYQLPYPLIRNLWLSIFYSFSFFQNVSWLNTVKTEEEAST